MYIHLSYVCDVYFVRVHKKSTRRDIHIIQYDIYISDHEGFPLYYSDIEKWLGSLITLRYFV